MLGKEDRLMYVTNITEFISEESPGGDTSGKGEEGNQQMA